MGWRTSTRQVTSPYLDRVGRAFPGGCYEIEPWRAWLVADGIGDDPCDETPHPVLAWMAAAGGMGLTWPEFFGWFDATAADGPMFGEHRTSFHGPLQIGTTYDVHGGVVSVERKHGRVAGVFDLVSYELILSTDRPVVSCYNSIIFPRRSR